MFVAFMTCWRYSLGSLRHDPSVAAKEPLSGNLRDGRGDVDTVLPLELGPHAPELKSLTVSAMANELLCSGCTDLLLRAIRRLDVVHDIDVDVVQDDALLCQTRPFPENAAEDDTSFRR